MYKSTKIVATIGPATDSEETIQQLIEAGMNVARFNTKHNTPNWHTERIKRVHQVAARMGVAVAVLLDLQGPEIRISIPGEKEIPVKQNQQISFFAEETMAEAGHPHIPQVVIDSLKAGNRILIDDGLGEFEVKESKENKLITIAQGDFVIKHRKTLNTPGVFIDLPSLIDQDLTHLDAANNDLVDYVGLSFVRNANDLKTLKRELKKRNLTADVIAKIENQSALDHLVEIIEESDAIMVARGDLAVEVPFEELTFWQKQIIQRCREHGKPVIVATQMLKSMVENPRPTRAEVSDVAHAIYDGTDAVMLSEETTIGKFPVKALTTQAKIVDFNEDHACFSPVEPKYYGSASYITHAAINLVKDSIIGGGETRIDKIVCLTETGTTAKLAARFRPSIPIHAITSNRQTYRKLSLLYDVTPHMIELTENEKLELTGRLLEKLKEKGLTQMGEHILLIHGTIWKKPGLTNTLSLIKIKE